MRLYPNQIIALESVILDVREKKKVLDAEVKNQIELNKKWGSKDRKNFYQAAYDIIRHYELLEKLSTKHDTSIIETYQNFYLEKQLDLTRIKSENPDLKINELISIPSELYDLFLAEDDHADANLKAMHSIGEIYIRVNVAMISMNDFEAKLKRNEIAYELIDSIKVKDKELKLNCIKLKSRTQQHREFFEFNKDFFEIQDLGSQILTEYIDFSKATTIIESCAGHGGKTSHILDKTKEWKPLILAFDIERKKIEYLRSRISKWKNHKVVGELAKEKEIQKYTNMADILYMDMPCTGSGTLKRQSDLKYRIDADVIKEKQTTQREIFHKFDETLKEGGQLIYTTCSLFKSENESQVEYISNQGYECIYTLHIEPSEMNTDGFFLAKLIKKRPLKN